MGYKELYKKAKESGELRDLTPEYFQWIEENQMIVGKFINKLEVTSSQGSGVYYQYVFDTDNGLIKFSLGRLADKEVGDNLVQGKVYAIVYQGKRKIPGGRQVNQFKVLEVGDVDLDDESETGDIF